MEEGEFGEASRAIFTSLKSQQSIRKDNQNQSSQEIQFWQKIPTDRPASLVSQRLSILTTNPSHSDGKSQRTMVVVLFLITLFKRKINLVAGLMPLSLMIRIVLPQSMNWKHVCQDLVKASGISSELLLSTRQENPTLPPKQSLTSADTKTLPLQSTKAKQVQRQCA